MKVILALAFKDLRILFRDKAGLFWVLAFPLLYALFFGAIFSGSGGGGRTMSVALVDLDRTPGSQKFTERLGRSQSLRLESMELDRARELVRKGDLTAYVLLPRGFGEASSLFRGAAAGPRLEVGIDPSRRAEEGYLQGILMQSWFAGFRELFTDRERMKQELRRSRESIAAAKDLNPVQKALFSTFMGSLDKFVDGLGTSGLEGEGGFQGPRIEKKGITRNARSCSSFEVTFPSAILWGILGCVAGFAISLVRERVQGTLMRLRVAPINTGHILAGKGLACFLASLAVVVLLLLFGNLALGVRITDPLMLLVGAAATAFCFSGIMMFLSVLGRTEQAVAGVGWAVMMVMAMLGGGMVPLIAMPGWMLTASSFSPVKWGIISLEGAIWRGFSWAEMVPPLAVLLLVGVVGLALGGTILSRTRD